LKAQQKTAVLEIAIAGTTNQLVTDIRKERCGEKQGIIMKGSGMHWVSFTRCGRIQLLIYRSGWTHTRAFDTTLPTDIKMFWSTFKSYRSA
jgi:hypothetical protein